MLATINDVIIGPRYVFQATELTLHQYSRTTGGGGRWWRGEREEGKAECTWRGEGRGEGEEGKAGWRGEGMERRERGSGGGRGEGRERRGGVVH